MDRILIRVLLNSNIGVLNSNFLILTPTFRKVPIVKYRKNATILEKPQFYSNFQNPVENSADYSEKENGPRASSAPALGLNTIIFNTIIFKHVYWYMQQISGEHLQDHFSSGLSVSGENYTLVVCISFRVLSN